MAESICCNAICLRVTDFSESSQIVTLLTDGHGLVSLIAKGIRRVPQKTGSPLPAPLDIVAAGQVVFIPARQPGQLGTLTAWDVTDHRPQIRQNYQKIIISQVLAEVTLSIGGSEDSSGDMLRHLERTLEDLAAHDSLRPVVAYLKYAAATAGYAPDLALCSACRSPLGAHAGIRRFAVGLFCDRCSGSDVLIRVQRRILVALDRLPAPCDLPLPELQPPSEPDALIQAAQMLLYHLQVAHENHLRLVEPFRRLLKDAAPDRPATVAGAGDGNSICP